MMFGNPMVKYNSVMKIKTEFSFFSCPITHSLDVAPDKSLQGPEPEALLCNEGVGGIILPSTCLLGVS